MSARSARESNDGDGDNHDGGGQARSDGVLSKLGCIIPKPLRRLLGRSAADKRPVERLQFKAYSALSDHLFILNHSSSKTLALGAYVTTLSSAGDSQEALKSLFKTTFESRQSLEHSLTSGLKESHKSSIVWSCIKKAWFAPEKQNFEIHYDSIRVFDCGANATRFLDLQGRQIQDLDQEGGFNLSLIKGLDEGNLLSIARFPSDHGEGPRCFEILFQEAAAIADFMRREKDKGAAIIICANEDHLTKLLHVVGKMMHGKETTTKLGQYTANGLVKNQKMDFSVSNAQKNAALDRLLGVFSLFNKKLALPFNVILTSVRFACDYPRLSKMWEAAETRRRLKKHRTGRHLKSFHSALLSTEGLDSFIMVTNDADIVFASITAQPVEDLSADISVREPPKFASFGSLTYFGADLNREIQGDMRVRIFCKASPSPSAIHLTRTATKRPELVNAWFHAALLVEPVRMLLVSSNEPINRIRIRTSFDLPSQLDRPSRLGADLDAFKLEPDEVLFKTILFFDVILDNDCNGESKATTIEATMCSSCLELRVDVANVDKIRCKCGLTSYDFLARIAYPPVPPSFLPNIDSPSEEDEEEEHDGEGDEEEKEQTHDIQAGTVLSSKEPLAGPLSLLCEMFPQLGHDRIRGTLLEHNLGLDDEFSFNLAVDILHELSTVGLRRTRGELVENCRVNTPAGPGIVLDPESTCNLPDGDVIVSIKVSLPYGVGYFHPSFVTLATESDHNQSGGKPSHEALQEPSSSRTGATLDFDGIWSSERNRLDSNAFPLEPRPRRSMSNRQQRRFGIRMERPPYQDEIIRELSGVIAQEELDAILALSLQNEDDQYSRIESGLYRRESRRILDALPVSTFTQDVRKGVKKRSHKESMDESLRKCLVCQHDFVNMELIRTLPCFHRFHAECVDSWLVSKTTCPLCLMNVDPDHTPE